MSDLQRDPSTNTVSRPDFDRLIEWELGRSREGGRPFTLAVLDLDRFADLARDVGPEAAETLLRRIAETLRAHSREGDVLGRGEGDQFLLLLPATPPEQGLFIVEDVRRLLASSTFKLRAAGVARTARCTVSAGLASYPKDGSARDELTWKAEAALLAAKSAGRNRVCLAVDEKMVLKSNYYPRSQLDQLSALARALGRTEASLLREALTDLFRRHEAELKGHARRSP
jgi:diguanylate cyclase (GGDEF)-like protein